MIAALGATAALAQGTDQPPSQRDAMVIGRWLPGHYENTEQVYFDGRARAGVRRRAGWRIEPVVAPAVGLPAFRAERAPEGGASRTELWTLDWRGARDRVRMARSTGKAPLPAAGDLAGWAALKPADLRPAGCALDWRRQAGQFTAEAAADCRAAGPRHAELTADQLWLGRDETDADRFRRARDFQCFVDMPGVGGGRAEPFKRFSGLRLHDQGGEARFTTAEPTPRVLGLRLRNVHWGYNNAPGQFTRDVLAMYLYEVRADGGTHDLAYSFVEPRAERTGINLKWLLANCHIRSPEEATPEF